MYLVFYKVEGTVSTDVLDLQWFICLLQKVVLALLELRLLTAFFINSAL